MSSKLFVLKYGLFFPSFTKLIDYVFVVKQNLCLLEFKKYWFCVMPRNKFVNCPKCKLYENYYLNP